MRRATFAAVAFIVLGGVLFFPLHAPAQEASGHNTLIPQERENSWELLFDGETTDGWRGYNQEAFPDEGGGRFAMGSSSFGDRGAGSAARAATS